MMGHLFLQFLVSCRNIQRVVEFVPIVELVHTATLAAVVEPIEQIVIAYLY